MIRYLIKFLCQKPIFFDVFILALLPIYSHAIVIFHRREPTWELMQTKPYWTALGFTWICALVVVGYIKSNNRRFDKQHGIHDSVFRRLEKQWLWNFLPPVAFVLLAVAVYYAAHNTSLLHRGYFTNEFAFVVIGIFCLVVLYSSFEVLCFVVSEAEERSAFEAFKAQVISEQQAKVEPTVLADVVTSAIQVQHYYKNELHRVPIHEIGMIEHRNAKTVLYTYNGEKYRLPTTKVELRHFSKRYGFHWLSPFYGFAIDAISFLAPKRDGSLLIALKLGIEPVPQKQVVPPSGENGEDQQFSIKIHKNNASKVRSRYKELVAPKGRPDSERP
ncbi:hypothetical protein ACFOET_19755 [Parapedobacter deserti]|uniref:LytTR family transcriptional regulator n=1 Tax=Parapedobacter deserti TaxID=1912957 RepID=A0ABV7JP61_9SPHI